MERVLWKLSPNSLLREIIYLCLSLCRETIQELKFSGRALIFLQWHLDINILLLSFQLFIFDNLFRKMLAKGFLDVFLYFLFYHFFLWIYFFLYIEKLLFNLNNIWIKLCYLLCHRTSSFFDRFSYTHIINWLHWGCLLRWRL